MNQLKLTLSIIDTYRSRWSRTYPGDLRERLRMTCPLNLHLLLVPSSLLSCLPSCLVVVSVRDRVTMYSVNVCIVLYHLLTINYDVVVIVVFSGHVILNIRSSAKSDRSIVQSIHCIAFKSLHVHNGITLYHLLVHYLIHHHCQAQSCLAKATRLINGELELFSKLLICLVFGQQQKVETGARLR